MRVNLENLNEIMLIEENQILKPKFCLKEKRYIDIFRKKLQLSLQREENIVYYSIIIHVRFEK